MARLIAIAGGIGSGKSVVSRILRAMGNKVYDCDTEARRLMDNDENIKCRIKECIAPEVILADRSIDRRRLAAIVFADKRCLTPLTVSCTRRCATIYRVGKRLMKNMALSGWKVP